MDPWTSTVLVHCSGPLGSIFTFHYRLDPVHIVEYFGVEAVPLTTPDAPGYNACGHPVKSTIVPHHKDAATVPLADTIHLTLIPNTEHVLRKHLNLLPLAEPGLTGLPGSYRQL